MIAPMTDDELVAYLGLTPEQAPIVIPKITPDRRALYDRMREVEIEAELWVKGLGPKPTGVLLDTERAVSKRRGWRRAGL